MLRRTGVVVAREHPCSRAPTKFCSRAPAPVRRVLFFCSSRAVTCTCANSSRAPTKLLAHGTRAAVFDRCDDVSACCVSTHVCQHVRMCVSMSVCVRICVRMCQNVCQDVSGYVRMCQDVSAHMSMCVRMCQNVSACVRMQLVHVSTCLD